MSWNHGKHARQEVKTPCKCPEALWFKQNIGKCWSLIKCWTYWSVISLRWCPVMAVCKCYAFRLKWKNLILPTPGVCNPLLALSVFIGAGQPLQHGEVRDSSLAWMRPVLICVVISFGVVVLSVSVESDDWELRCISCNSQDCLEVAWSFMRL